jgi:hypothetical protein
LKNQTVFFFTKITDEQAAEVLHNMGKGTRLKRLQMTNHHILNIQPEILGSAMNKVENLFLEDALINYGPAFTQEQIIGIFTAMSHGTNLKELILLDIDIALIEPSTLASALSKVEEVRVWRSFLRTGSYDISVQQAQELFSILSEETKLKRLFLLTRNMVNIDPGVLAKALNNLKEITHNKSQYDNGYSSKKCLQENDRENIPTKVKNHEDKPLKHTIQHIGQRCYSDKGTDYGGL